MANKKYKLDGDDYWEASGVYDIGQSDTQRNINDDVVTKLATIEEGAEVNQNAFSNVTVGGTTIAADSKTDTLTLTAGSNITLTPNATNDSVTIAAKDTTYDNATRSAAGLMSAADKTKLDTLDSSDITDNSDVGGATVEASLTSLKGSLNTIESAIAIVADGNTHAAIASGQYVYIKNHASLAEGLYKATAAIPLNGTLSSSVVVSANSALNTISNSVADIGTRAYWENGTNHNFDVPNDLDFDCGSITLASGRWLIIGTGDWASNAVGYRQISFASGKNPARQYTSTTQACESGKETFHQIVAFFESNGTEAVHLYARQNSGETIKIFPLLYAVKIGEYQ